jgi:hypothetical protein
MQTEPTARADVAAEIVRQWYDKNHETWWQRHAPVFLGGTYVEGWADNFILELMAVVRQADETTGRNNQVAHSQKI